MIEVEEVFYKNLGSAIKAARNKEGISQEELANHLNLSRISVVNIEKGKQKVQIFTLNRIAEFLKVSWENLIPGKNVDILTSKVLDKVSKAGGDSDSAEKIKSLIDTINSNLT